MLDVLLGLHALFFQQAAVSQGGWYEVLCSDMHEMHVKVVPQQTAGPVHARLCTSKVALLSTQSWS